MSITTKSLYTQINSLIEQKATRFASGAVKSATTGRQTASSSTETMSFVNTATTEDVVNSISEILANVIEARIISGLEVTETSNPTLSVRISAGKGTAGGQFYELKKDTLLHIPIVPTVGVYYINIYHTGIKVEYKTNDRTLTIAKIIAPFPAYTQAIYNRKDDIRADDKSKAYIQSFHKYNLYGILGRFEEDTIELLRDNIGELLADNLIGNIRLSENLKITNTSGTLELNSDSLKLKNFEGDLLAKLTGTGIFFTNAKGTELAKFTTTGARIGNIVVTGNSLESIDFAEGDKGFRIGSNGDTEFNNIVARGTIDALDGIIGGWTIAKNELYATTTGTIKTSATAGAGRNGVVLDKDGIRVYDAILGLVANFPSDGSKPSISAGNVGGITFEVNTNTVIRTSDTVGDGSANSFGLLMNNTGLYGCGPNQKLSDANFKVLANGEAYFKGNITANSGNIGGISIIDNELVGGILRGSTLQGANIETSGTLPKIAINESGIYYQLTSDVGIYGEVATGSTGFLYGDGTIYGIGITAYLFNNTLPVLSVMAELPNVADIRLYNRSEDPQIGTQEYGDLICVNSSLKICQIPGSPGVFEFITQSSAIEGGTGSAGSGCQYVELRVGNKVYKVLHDGEVPQ